MSEGPIGFDEAQIRLAGAVRALGTEVVALDLAAGRTLAMPVVAPFDAPSSAVSMMDGYGVRAGDLMAGETRLRVAGEAWPGRPFPDDVAPGACVRLFTGAPMPRGCDRVVIQERTRRENDLVIIEGGGSAATFVRPAGSDFRLGQVLLAPGTLITPQAIIAAAAGDQAELEVFLRPRVAVIATGDELAAPGRARGVADAVPDSAGPAVAAMARAWGADVVLQARMGDDLSVLSAWADRALDAADLVVTIGGASVGERDFARLMFAAHRPESIFSKVAMRPGKPVFLARAASKLVLGLPGNPGSALVTARLFLAPLLLGLGGRSPAEALRWASARLAAPLGPTGERETFYRARRVESGLAPVENQDSGAQMALALADALIRRRPLAAACARGDPVEFLAL